MWLGFAGCSVESIESLKPLIIYKSTLAVCIYIYSEISLCKIYRDGERYNELDADERRHVELKSRANSHFDTSRIQRAKWRHFCFSDPVFLHLDLAIH